MAANPYGSRPIYFVLPSNDRNAILLSGRLTQPNQEQQRGNRPANCAQNSPSNTAVLTTPCYFSAALAAVLALVHGRAHAANRLRILAANAIHIPKELLKALKRRIRQRRKLQGTQVVLKVVVVACAGQCD